MTVSVTAVIPVYNGERFLAEAIESALEQTRPPNACIVVDDGSLDGSADVARSYGDRVQLVQQPNGGVAAARNQGVRAATTSYVAFLDADDVWLPDKLARQVELLEVATPPALTYTGLRAIDAQGRVVEERPAPTAADALRNSLLLEQPTISVPSTGVFSRSVLLELGGFDESLSTSADTDLACRVAAHHPIAAIVEPLVLYRLHDGQMSSNATAMELDMERVIAKLFADPAVVRSIGDLRRRARANLHATLAADALARRRPLLAARHIAVAIGQDPRRSLQLGVTRLRR